MFPHATPNTTKGDKGKFIFTAPVHRHRDIFDTAAERDAVGEFSGVTQIVRLCELAQIESTGMQQGPGQ